MGPPRDLVTLVPADFQAVVGSEFRVRVGQSGSIVFRLVQVIELSGHPGQRQPFILRFQGPATPVLDQLVHYLEHADLCHLEIFLGPNSTEAEATIYEAVFA
jgi:hypothetical protein